MVVGLLLQSLEVVASPVGRETPLGTRGPTRRVQLPVIQGALQIRAAVGGTVRTTRSLAPLEAVTTVTIAVA